MESSIVRSNCGFRLTLRDQQLSPSGEMRLPACRAIYLTGIVALLIFGCHRSTPPVSVEGSISFRRVPIENGAIRFIPDGGNPDATAASVIENGRYTIPTDKQLAPGSYLVSIYGFKETGRMVKFDESSPERKEQKQFVPRQYNDATTSLCNLSAGHNTLDFSLD